MAIFEAPHSSIPVGDRHIHPLIFLYQIESLATFIEAFFDILRIFGSVEL